MIQVRDLRFRWRRDTPVVLDIADLRIARGERLFLRGPSGSGKTTLLNLLAGAAVAEEGRIDVLDHDLARLGAGARDRLRADHMGLIFQTFNLVPYLNLIENVTLACLFSARKRARAEGRDGSPEGAARRLLAAMGLGDDDLAGRTVAELSIGQQQRVAAARALIGEPDLIIADEATSALDAGNARQFLDLLFRESEALDATLLFVSHDERLAAGFTRSLDLGELGATCGVEP